MEKNNVIYRVGLLKDPQEDDKSYDDISLAYRAIKDLSFYDDEVYAIWDDRDDLVILSYGGQMFRSM